MSRAQGLSASELWDQQVWLGGELVGVVVAVGCARGGEVRKVGVPGDGQGRPFRFLLINGAKLDDAGLHIAPPADLRVTA